MIIIGLCYSAAKQYNTNIGNTTRLSLCRRCGQSRSGISRETIG